MNSKDMEEILHDLLDAGEEVSQVRSFNEVGMLTNDCGLVVSMRNGAQFHITVQRVR